MSYALLWIKCFTHFLWGLAWQFVQSLFTCLDLARLWQVPAGVVDVACSRGGWDVQAAGREGKAVVRPAAAVGGHSKTYNCGIHGGMTWLWDWSRRPSPDPLENALYPQTKWHGLASREGKILSKSTWHKQEDLACMGTAVMRNLEQCILSLLKSINPKLWQLQFMCAFLPKNSWKTADQAAKFWLS